MTKLDRAVAALFELGLSISEITKVVGVDPTQVQNAIRLRLQEKKK